MGKAERLAEAQGSDDLGEKPNALGDVDFVRATGAVSMSDPLGVSFWRWRYGGSPRDVIPLAQMLLDRGHTLEAVTAALRWLATDTCPACQGRRYERLYALPVLSDILCAPCGGTGKTPRPGGAATAVLDYLQEVEYRVAGRVMARLKDALP